MVFSSCRTRLECWSRLLGNHFLITRLILPIKLSLWLSSSVLLVNCRLCHREANLEAQVLAQKKVSSGRSFLSVSGLCCIKASKNCNTLKAGPIKYFRAQALARQSSSCDNDSGGRPRYLILDMLWLTTSHEFYKAFFCRSAGHVKTKGKQPLFWPVIITLLKVWQIHCHRHPFWLSTFGLFIFAKHNFDE